MPRDPIEILERSKRGLRVVAGIASGALFALAAPPLDFYPALWLGMAALAFVVDRGAASSLSPNAHASRWSRELSGAGIGLGFGIGANVVALRFVPDVIARFTPLPWAAGALALVLLSCEQGVRWAAAGVVQTQLSRRGIPVWLAFAAGIYAGTFVPSVFPWSPAGGVTPVPEMVQLADVVGERGVAFLMAASAGLLASAVGAACRRDVRRASASLAFAVALPLATFFEGRGRIVDVEGARSAAETAKVALVQPSTPALERWDPEAAQTILSRLTGLTTAAEANGVELTVWPEAAYPFEVPHDARRCPTGARAILPVGVAGPVLTGLVLRGSDGDVFNSAAICRADGSMSEPYDKIHLLWFGETLPVIDRIPWIRRTFSRGTGMVPGTAPILEVAGPIRCGVLNCFEDTLSAAGRSAMTERPNLLVNVTNDAWFAGSAESELHLRLSALRAVESRRDLVRAVNFGPTTWIDAAGVVEARYEGSPPGVLIASPALLDGGPTPFDRFGDAPCAFSVLALAIGSMEYRRRRRARSARV